jgi:pyruvate,orthophosphate dikinase
MALADKYKRSQVRANADTPDDAKVARNFGATGIGLCRTEHMFFAGDRIKAVREMILADDEAGRRKALPSCCRCSAATSKACSAR